MGARRPRAESAPRSRSGRSSWRRRRRPSSRKMGVKIVKDVDKAGFPEDRRSLSRQARQGTRPARREDQDPDPGDQLSVPLHECVTCARRAASPRPSSASVLHPIAHERRGWAGVAGHDERLDCDDGELEMSIADKLVLQRQHHLKWRSFDRLELILMIVCGAVVFRFFAVGDGRHRHPHHRPSLAVAAGSNLHAVHLRDLHRRRGRHPPQRSSLSDRDLRGDARHAAADRRDHHPHRRARRGVLPDLVRLHQLSPGLRQFPAAVGHADRLALCGDSAVRRADRAVHDRATGQRHPNGFDHPEPPEEDLRHSACRHQHARRGWACERACHSRR